MLLSTATAANSRAHTVTQSATETAVETGQQMIGASNRTATATSSWQDNQSWSSQRTATEYAALTSVAISTNVGSNTSWVKRGFVSDERQQFARRSVHRLGHGRQRQRRFALRLRNGWRTRAASAVRSGCWVRRPRTESAGQSRTATDISTLIGNSALHTYTQTGTSSNTSSLNHSSAFDASQTISAAELSTSTRHSAANDTASAGGTITTSAYYDEIGGSYTQGYTSQSSSTSTSTASASESNRLWGRDHTGQRLVQLEHANRYLLAIGQCDRLRKRHDRPRGATRGRGPIPAVRRIIAALARARRSRRPRKGSSGAPSARTDTTQFYLHCIGKCDDVRESRKRRLHHVVNRH